MRVMRAPRGRGRCTHLDPVVLVLLFVKRHTLYHFPKDVWLPASKGKGIEILGTLRHRHNNYLLDKSFG